MARLSNTEVPIRIKVDLSEVHEARVRMKRLARDVDSLVRLLARLESNVLEYSENLELLGIKIEMED